MCIGANIKRLRKEKGLTQQELAESSNISRSYLADVENERYNPSVDVLKSIAKSLGVKLSILLEEESNIVKEDSAKYGEQEFESAEEAMKFILEQNVIMGFGGFDVSKMSDEEVVEFANELLRQLKLLSYKYKK